MKTLLAIALSFALVGATESVDKPFKYFLSTMNISADTVYYGLTPTVVIPDMILTNADSGKTGLDVEAFNRIGAGIDYGRYVKSTDGKVYETFGASLFALVATTKDVIAGGAFHLFNRTLGLGGGVDLGNVPKSKRFVVFLISGIKLF
jgi:hypothetical protein